jgi:hypothetical protein
VTWYNISPLYALTGIKDSRLESMQQIRGVWLIGHGNSDKLEVRSDILSSEPGSGEVRIRVVSDRQRFS